MLTNPSLIISKQTARRFILGKQGLWPGRRWVGSAGTAQALRQVEVVQVDSISVVGRNHDLALWSRVKDYNPADLNALLYSPLSRQFFDYGTILMLYPLVELVYWQPVMQGWHSRLADYRQTHQIVFDYVRQELKERGPLGSRDFTGRTRVPGGFNTVKDTAKALHYLWLGGELMTHHRRGFERIYDFSEKVVPAHFLQEPSKVSLPEADAFLGLKAMRELGLARAKDWAKRFRLLAHRLVSPKEAQTWLEERVLAGDITKIGIAGQAETLFYYVLTADLPLLNLLEAGRLPAEWLPVDEAENTLAQINLLAPLDSVIWDRGRLQSLFDFDYVWEVYKPAAIRRWGYYTLPILFDDRLVGRLSPRLERKSGILSLEGFWLEDDFALRLAQASAAEEKVRFRVALVNGLQNFARYQKASQIVFPVSCQPLLQNLGLPGVLESC